MKPKGLGLKVQGVFSLSSSLPPALSRALSLSLSLSLSLAHSFPFLSSVLWRIDRWFVHNLSPQLDLFGVLCWTLCFGYLIMYLLMSVTPCGLAIIGSDINTPTASQE